MAVLVTAAATVLPSYPDYVRDRRLKAAAWRLASALHYAAEWSALHGKAVVLEYDKQRETFTLTVEGSDAAEGLLARPGSESEEEAPQEENAPALDPAWTTVRLPDGVTVVAQEVHGEALSGSEYFRFLGDGRSNDGVVVLGLRDRRRSVQWDGRRGRARVVTGDVLAEGDADVPGNER